MPLPRSRCVAVCPVSLFRAVLCLIQTHNNLKSNNLSWQNLYVSFNLSLARAVCLKSKAGQKTVCFKNWISVIFLCHWFYLCTVYLCVSAGLQSPVPRSPIPPAAPISLLHFFLSLQFSHIQVCSFPILQDWHLLLLHNTYQMRDVTGADEEKEEDESPIYHVSILSRWIIEKHDRLTRVAWSCVCWLFFGRLSLFTMLHNLFAPLPAWHQPVHLFVCLPPGSRLLLPTAST